MPGLNPDTAARQGGRTHPLLWTGLLPGSLGAGNPEGLAACRRKTGTTSHQTATEGLSYRACPPLWHTMDMDSVTGFSGLRSPVYFRTGCAHHGSRVRDLGWHGW
jgi:hypothetical protein